MKLRNTLLVAALVAAPTMAQAQVGTLSNAATVTLNATRNASITVTPTVPSLTMASAIVDNSTANTFGSVGITTDYSVSSGANVVLYGYFGSSAAALSSGTNDIPSDWVEGTVDGTNYSPFSGMALTNGGTFGVDNATLVLQSITIPSGGVAGTATTTLGLRLNTTGRKVVAGSYTGTLNLRAVVQ